MNYKHSYSINSKTKRGGEKKNKNTNFEFKKNVQKLQKDHLI